MLGQQQSVIIGQCQQEMLLTHKLKKNRLSQERLVDDKSGTRHTRNEKYNLTKSL